MLRFNVSFPIPQPHHDPGLIRLAVGRGAQKVVDAVILLSPGRAKLGWKIRFLGNESAQVYADQNPPLSLWLEYGTGKFGTRGGIGREYFITRHGAVIGKGLVAPGRELYGPGSGRARGSMMVTRRSAGWVPRKFRGKVVGFRTGRPMLRFETDKSLDPSSGLMMGDVHFAPQVKHPGIKPRYYLREAWQTNQAGIINDIRITARNKISGELGIYPGAGGTGSGRYGIRVGTKFAKLR